MIYSVNWTEVLHTALCKRECIYVIIFQTEQQTLIRKENELYARQHDIIPHKYFLTPIKHTYTIPTFPNSGTSSQKKKNSGTWATVLKINKINNNLPISEDSMIYCNNSKTQIATPINISKLQKIVCFLGSPIIQQPHLLLHIFSLTQKQSIDIKREKWCVNWPICIYASLFKWQQRNVTPKIIRKMKNHHEIWRVIKNWFWVLNHAVGTSILIGLCKCNSAEILFNLTYSSRGFSRLEHHTLETLNHKNKI